MNSGGIRVWDGFGWEVDLTEDPGYDNPTLRIQREGVEHIYEPEPNCGWAETESSGDFNEPMTFGLQEFDEHGCGGSDPGMGVLGGCRGCGCGGGCGGGCQGAATAASSGGSPAPSGGAVSRLLARAGGSVRVSAESDQAAVASSPYTVLDWIIDWILGPCADGRASGGWADCEIQCRSVYPGSIGTCKAVAADCRCLWCECHNYSGGGGGPEDPTEPEEPEDGPIIWT